MKTPFLDMKAPYLELRAELDAAYQGVMESGQYILGEEVNAFEAQFAAYCGARHCIGVGNGLEALHLILRGVRYRSRRRGDRSCQHLHCHVAGRLVRRRHARAGGARQSNLQSGSGSRGAENAPAARGRYCPSIYMAKPQTCNRSLRPRDDTVCV